jgi:hypothetical protein
LNEASESAKRETQSFDFDPFERPELKAGITRMLSQIERQDSYAKSIDQIHHEISQKNDLTK